MPPERPALLAAGAMAPYPLFNGYALRVHHLLRHLAEEWRITLVSPEAAAPWPLAARMEAWHRVTGSGVGAKSALTDATLAALKGSSAKAALLWAGAEEAALRHPDLFPPIIVDRIDSATLHAWRNRAHARTVREWASAVSDVANRAREERRILKIAQATVVVGSDDARVLRTLRMGSRVEVVPNGCDVEPGITSAAAGNPTVVFSGVLDYPPNVEAVRFFSRQVWPEVRRLVPDSEWIIVGSSPNAQVRRVASEPGVSLWADVPDVRDCLRHAWVAVVPMRSGCGIKNKVLEAWAVKRPVVLTSIAANGIQLDPISAELVVSSAGEMVEQIVRLLMDASARERYGTQGYELCRSQHRWDVAAQRMHRLLESAGQFP